MIVFYTTDVDLENNAAVLYDQEAVHAAKALRKSKGEKIYMTDGKGSLYEGLIASSKKGEMVIKELNVLRTQERKLPIAIAIALTKNNTRIETFLEKATEIGVSEFFLMTTHNSEKTHSRMDRFNRILIAAMKQSLNLHLPKLHDIEAFDKIMRESEYREKFIAHCREPESHLLKLYSGKEPAICFIGPEGDFTEEEVALAKEHGCKETNLGISRLRTETAGVVAATLLQAAIDIS